MDRSFNSGGKLFSRQHRTQLLLAAFAFTCAVTCAPVSAVSAAADKKWLDLQHAGTTALDSNEYWKAEPLLKSAVIEAGSFGQDDLRLAKSIGELGRLYTVRGRFTDAEPLLEEELCIKQRALGIGSGQVVPAMGKMVRFYFLYGSISKADPLTEDILAVVENKLREPVDQASPKLTLKKGAPLVGWAGSAAPIARDPILEWAITCDDLGSLYRLRQNYAMADRLFKDGLDLKATVLGKQHLSLANSYDSLAEICSSKDEFRDAESYFTEAVELT
jgi:tetratricopeptide (TPR) repeat protein